MIFGLDGFTFFHIVLSLVGIFAGFVVVGGFLSNAFLSRATLLFLVTTAATSITGFLFPFSTLLPSHIVGLVSLAVLAVTGYALYGGQLAGAWRWVFVAGSVASLYLNVFVLVVQTFVKNPSLQTLAPTQSEPAFVATQAVTLAAFVVLALWSLKTFRGASA